MSTNAPQTPAQLNLVVTEDGDKATEQARAQPAQIESIIAAAKAKETEADETFDWDCDDSVVVQSQPGIAVYDNNFGDAVVRVQNIFTPDDGDDFAVVSTKALPAVIAALKKRIR
jgi:hypothetical protein